MCAREDENSHGSVFPWTKEVRAGNELFRDLERSAKPRGWTIDDRIRSVLRDFPFGSTQHFGDALNILHSTVRLPLQRMDFEIKALAWITQIRTNHLKMI
jgi:hypothetical protein